MSGPTQPLPNPVQNKWKTFLERMLQFKEIWGVILLISGAITTYLIWSGPPIKYQINTLQFTWSYPSNAERQYFVCTSPVFERTKPGVTVVKNVVMWIALTDETRHFNSKADAKAAVQEINKKYKRSFELFGWTETRDTQELETACKPQTARIKTPRLGLPTPITLEGNAVIEKVLRFSSVSKGENVRTPFKLGQTSLLQVCVYVGDDNVPANLSKRPQIDSDDCRHGDWFSVLSPENVSALSSEVPSVRIKSIKRL
jgi:hypothetical protein